MRPTTLLALAAPALLLQGCNKTDVVVTEIAYPVMALSQASLEFGSAEWGETVERVVTLRQAGLSKDGLGMKMGVQSIEIGEHMGANFSVTYDLAEMTCPEAAPSDTGTTAAAKSEDVDTGPTDTGGADTAATDDTGGTATGDGNVLFTMDPLCELPLHVRFSPVDVGEVWGGVVLKTVTAALPDGAEEGTLPDYYKDPIHSEQEVFLHGNAQHAQGKLVVRPRSYDFGYVHPDDTTDHVAYIELQNVGDGDVTIHSVTLSEACDASFSLDIAPAPESTVAEGETGLVAVSFHPTDTNGAYCQMVVSADDPADPEVDVILTANSGSDALNHPPTVAIRDPENGYKYTTIRDFTMELNTFDRDQPATSLSCKVKSAIVQNASIATCTAPDDSGHFWVTIPRGDMESGIDTLVVTVTDGSGVSAEASVSVLVDTDYPVDDDDGDGYGPSSEENPDCDDANRNSYPKAAEIYDNADNDCDGIVDENTVGYDDDGDSVTELEGDCNDYDDTAFPGAIERGDGVDNDCDDIVDEGTTLYDDDGDGYAEVNGDCRDYDPAFNPAATEICDGFDNDCDGLTDQADGCVSTDSNPMVIGSVRSNDANACESGEIVTLEAKVFDPDGQIPTLAWQDDSGAPGNFDNQSSAVTHWTCPELDANSGGKAFSVYVTATDPDGHADYDFVRISVYPQGYGLHDPWEKVEYVDSKGCASAPSTPGALLVAAGGLATALLRRRSGR